MEKFAAHVEASQQRYLDELYALLRQPSIAAQGVGIEETAGLVAARLERLGADVKLMPVAGGAPVVFGSIGSGPRTLLIYDHYDVQPPEPLDQWHSPPFEPTIRMGEGANSGSPLLCARGVADNKGNTMLRIQAIESWLATEGELPIQINFMIEGGGDRLGSPGGVLPRARRAAARRRVPVGDRRQERARAADDHVRCQGDLLRGAGGARCGL
jgi:acetylornithine deacetylase/succinyl-diaminopimelate desuccinylase-like protein